MDHFLPKTGRSAVLVLFWFAPTALVVLKTCPSFQIRRYHRKGPSTSPSATATPPSLWLPVRNKLGDGTYLPCLCCIFSFLGSAGVRVSSRMSGSVPGRSASS